MERKKKKMMKKKKVHNNKLLLIIIVEYNKETRRDMYQKIGKEKKNKNVVVIQKNFKKKSLKHQFTDQQVRCANVMKVNMNSKCESMMILSGAILIYICLSFL